MKSFMWCASSPQMEILRKIIHIKSSENPDGNFYDGVSFSTVKSLQFSDCYFAIKRIHHIFFLENVPKTSCLQKIVFFEEKSIMDQRLNKAAAL